MLLLAVLTFVDKNEKERQRDFVNMQDLFAANFRPIKSDLGRSTFFLCLLGGIFCGLDFLSVYLFCCLYKVCVCLSGNLVFRCLKVC